MTPKSLDWREDRESQSLGPFSLTDTYNTDDFEFLTRLSHTFTQYLTMLMKHLFLQNPYNLCSETKQILSWRIEGRQMSTLVFYNQRT
jgi:hypothetical protein